MRSKAAEGSGPHSSEIGGRDSQVEERRRRRLLRFVNWRIYVNLVLSKYLIQYFL